jgi:uncharacterized protein with HEPN domain
MLLAANRAAEFIQGLDFQALAASQLHQAAVVRQLEIIGEAASRVSSSFREAHPGIPWPQMIGMRID